MRLGTQIHDPLAAARAAEIDEVIEVVASFRPVGEELPARVGVMFESLLLSYAALRTRNGEKVTVLLGRVAYDRAKDSGMLAWCAEHYPSLTFEPPSHVVRGCHANSVVLDEIAEL